MIYDVGVKRSIGATKGKILGQFLIENIIITTIFSLVGFILIVIFYNLVAMVVNHFLEKTFLITENTYYGVGVLCLYFVNIIFGMLPIVLLLRKTPAEICAKYDI